MGVLGAVVDKTVFLQKLSHELQRRPLVPLALDQNTKDFALGINRAPQRGHAAIDFQIDFVEMPACASWGAAPFVAEFIQAVSLTKNPGPGRKPQSPQQSRPAGTNCAASAFLTDAGGMCCEAAGHMLISAALEEHMCASLNQLMRIALLLTAIDAALVLFPVTAYAGSGYHRAIDARLAAAKNAAVFVNIDKTNQTMTVFLDGVARYEWPVSTGRAGYSTPSGTYTATSMNKIWYSKQWDNAPMPHSVFFMKDGHAIHGSFDVRNLGQPVSHGCVRISPKNAAILYALVEENGLQNTQVMVTGATPGGEYNVAKGQTSPRGDFFGNSFGGPPDNGSRGSYGSPWTYSRW